MKRSVLCESELGLSQLSESNIVQKQKKRESREVLVAMPAVGMRRTRRVFGVVKGSTTNRERVLRSGRRLWQEDESPGVKKSNAGGGGDEWIKKILDHKSSNNGWHTSSKSNKSDNKIKQRDTPFASDKMDEGRTDKMCGIKYYRKRKRNVLDHRDSEDKKYGIKFVRKKKKSSSDVRHRDMIAVVVEHFSSYGSSSFSLLASFLNSVLGYMKRTEVRLRSLCAFLLSEPIASVFSSHGIHFSQFQHLPSSSSFGACEIYGVMQFTPLFSVNYSALPFCFMYIQSSMLLRCEHLFLDLVLNPKSVHSDAEIFDGGLEESSFIISSGDHSCIDLDGSTWKKRGVNLSSPPARVTRRCTQSRNGFNSRSTRGKRSSLRSKRVRNPSFLLALPNTASRTCSDSYNIRRGAAPSSNAVSNQLRRRSVQNHSADNLKESKADMVGLKEASDSASCITNILVIEADRCYREEGATIILDHSPSNEGFLVVQKDGRTRCSFKAEYVMRPCASNRVTHAIIWTVDDNLKLEFSNRADWFLFKDLYKKCSQINVLDSTAKIIPIPGVSVVSGYEDDNGAIFSRPASYIRVDGDEVSRALVQKGPYYDMDSEDEEWLDKFNCEGLPISEPDEYVSRETFEFMVYELEKAFYHNAGDISDEKAAAPFCPKQGRKEVVEAVYNYWMDKRNQKRSSALVRVFQNYQPRRASLLSDTVFRKKRSFKRQPSQAGRAKQRNVLQAIVAERDVFDEESAKRKVAEAEASANRYIETAIAKRRRAQSLMESASMIAYKALKALRIAEAVQVADSVDATAASNFIEQLMDTDISEAN